MNKNEIARKLTRINQITEEVIYGLMQTGMTYRQAEEEVFRMLRERDSPRKPKTIERLPVFL